MARIYQVSSIDESVYFNTAKEAMRHKPGGDEPDSVERLDAAAECNRLAKCIDDTEREFNEARMALMELYEICDITTTDGTNVGRRAGQFLAKHPMSPATAGDRDGQRSYAG